MTLTTKQLAILSVVIGALALISTYIIPLLFPPTNAIDLKQQQDGTSNIQQAIFNSTVTNNIYYSPVTSYQDSNVICSEYDYELDVYKKNLALCNGLNSGDDNSISTLNAELSTKEGKSDYYLWYLRSSYEHNIGNYSDSITSGLISIALNNEWGPSYEPVASSYYRLGNIDKSKEYIRKGLELDPNSSFLNRILEEILYREGNYTGALEALNRALDTEPNNIISLQHKGLILIKLDKLSPALVTYLRLEELGDTTPQTYQNAAYIFSKMGAISEAIVYTEKYRQYSNNSSSSLCNLQLLYSATGNSQKLSQLKQEFPTIIC